jgi:hypothetical protein
VDKAGLKEAAAAEFVLSAYAEFKKKYEETNKIVLVVVLVLAIELFEDEDEDEREEDEIGKSVFTLPPHWRCRRPR